MSKIDDREVTAETRKSASAERTDESENERGERTDVSRDSEDNNGVRVKSKKRKRKKKHHKRKRKGSSSSDSSSDSESENDRSRRKKKKLSLNEGMFHVKTEQEENQYELPSKIVDYVQHYMDKFIPDKELKEKILTENPVPENIQKTFQLDQFMRDIMKDDKKSTEILIDSVLEKISDKTRDVYAPISRIWTYLEKVVKSGTEGDPIDVDIDKLLEHIQQAVLLLGQTANSITYHRRINALSVLMSQTEAKHLMKEKEDCMGKKDQLLGKDFRNQITKDREAKRKMDTFRKPTKYRSSYPGGKSAFNNKQPFRQGPSGRGGGQPSRYVYRGNYRGQNKGQFDKKTSLQQTENSKTCTRPKFKAYTSCGKEDVSKPRNSTGSSSSKAKVFFSGLGKPYKRSGNFIYNRGRLSDSFHFGTKTDKGPKKPKSRQGTEKTGTKGDFRDVEERSNKCLQRSKRSIHKYHLSGREEG